MASPRHSKMRGVTSPKKKTTTNTQQNEKEYAPIRTKSSPEKADQRRYSVLSQDVLETLENLQAEATFFEEQVIKIEGIAANAKNLSETERHQALGLCRQLNGQLDKLQFEKIDAVQTADLNSGKATAKANRKALTAFVDLLRPRVTAVHEKLLKLAKLKTK